MVILHRIVISLSFCQICSRSSILAYRVSPFDLACPTHQIWLNHAGYYPKNGPNKSNLEAQIDMIDESLRWAGINEATEVGA